MITIIFVIIFIVIALIFVVLGVYLIKQNKRKNRNLMALFYSYDKPKRTRILRLKKDLIDNNEFMSEYDALKLAIELEKRGWRKEIKIDGTEVYLWKKKNL